MSNLSYRFERNDEGIFYGLKHTELLRRKAKQFTPGYKQDEILGDKILHGNTFIDYYFIHSDGPETQSKMFDWHLTNGTVGIEFGFNSKETLESNFGFDISPLYKKQVMGLLLAKDFVLNVYEVKPLASSIGEILYFKKERVLLDTINNQTEYDKL